MNFVIFFLSPHHHGLQAPVVGKWQKREHTARRIEKLISLAHVSECPREKACSDWLST